MAADPEVTHSVENKDHYDRNEFPKFLSLFNPHGRVPLKKMYPNLFFWTKLIKISKFVEGQSGPEGLLGQKLCINITFYWENAVLADFED